MLRNHQKALTLSTVILMGGLLTACSTAPLTCDHALPTQSQITSVRAPIEINKPKQLVNLPILSEAPSAMTLSADHAVMQASQTGYYHLTMMTKQVNHLLAIQHNDPKHYAVSIKGSALKVFWKQANPYFIHQYHYAVITAHHLPSQIVKVNKVTFNGNQISYRIISKNALPQGYLNNLTITVES
jgi:hypothetical protein